MRRSVLRLLVCMVSATSLGVLCAPAEAQPAAMTVTVRDHRYFRTRAPIRDPLSAIVEWETPAGDVLLPCGASPVSETICRFDGWLAGRGDYTLRITTEEVTAELPLRLEGDEHGFFIKLDSARGFSVLLERPASTGLVVVPRASSDPEHCGYALRNDSSRPIQLSTPNGHSLDAELEFQEPDGTWRGPLLDFDGMAPESPREWPIVVDPGEELPIARSLCASRTCGDYRLVVRAQQRQYGRGWFFVTRSSVVIRPLP